MDLATTYEQSEQINELAAALAKAQGQIEGASKSSQNPHFKSKYADLASCWDACRAALSSNGIAVVQRPGAGQGRVEVTTDLVHASGQWMRSTLAMPLAKTTPQDVGSALTYARRYSLCAMVGIAPDDDDGEKAQQSFRDAPRPKKGPVTKEPQPGELESLPEPLEDPGLHRIEGPKLASRGQLLVDIPVEQLHAATKTERIWAAMTPADKANALAYLAAAAEKLHGVPLSEDSIPE